jgi:Icc-related predicted phosphoesterase
MKICMISDTHEMHSKVNIPPCDVLIHAGDITGRGALEKLSAFNAWGKALMEEGIVKQDFICIAGNHDLSLETNKARAEHQLKDLTYLNNNSAFVGKERYHVYGIPETLRFCDWAFNVTEEVIEDKLEAVPDNVDILVIHGPPWTVLDMNKEGTSCGSYALLTWIKKAQPKLVVCGHIHEGYGLALVGRTLVVNASICTAAYAPTNQPIVLDL